MILRCLFPFITNQDYDFIHSTRSLSIFHLSVASGLGPQTKATLWHLGGQCKYRLDWDVPPSSAH